jgi:hypothetical protein
MTLAILRTPSVWRKAAKLLVRLRWSAPASFALPRRSKH